MTTNNSRKNMHYVWMDDDEYICSGCDTWTLDQYQDHERDFFRKVYEDDPDYPQELKED